MKAASAIEELWMLGGPLQRMGRRLGLVRDGSNTLGLGLALGAFAWGVLLLLAILEGFGEQVFSLNAIAVHVRLLVVIPLLFLAETWVAPQTIEFTRYVVQTGIVPETSRQAWERIIRSVARIKDSGLVEGFLIALAFATPLVELIVPIPGRSGSWVTVMQSGGGGRPWANTWYLVFCLPLFRFLLLRCLWRLGLWGYLLWRLERLPLHLIPTHSDGAGGLGCVGIVQEHFAPLVVAISALISAEFAEGIASRTMPFETLYSMIPAVMLLLGVLNVTAFEDTWIRNRKASVDPLLGTPDLQSLADLTNSVTVVRRMRWIPGDRRLIWQISVCATLPLLPLFFLKYPLSQVSVRLFQALTGL